MRRTTLILHDSRLGQLKQTAALRGNTLSALVDEFLSDGLRRASAPKKRAPAWPTFKMGEPLVNIADRDQLFDAMENE